MEHFETLSAKPVYTAGKQEAIFAVCAAVSGMLLCNFILFGGFHLGFAIAAIASILFAAAYLHAGGCRVDGYSGTLLVLSMLTAAGFARSDDGFVKFVMLCFLLVASNLGLCLMAWQNRFATGGVTSVLDVPRTVFLFGVGQMPYALTSMVEMVRKGGPGVKKSIGVLVGLVIAVPVLGVMIPLLMSADAAFDGLLGLLPELDVYQLITTAIFGLGGTCVLFTRGVALRQSIPEPRKELKLPSISAWTVNTVLIAVTAVFGLYLVSQLAYFVGGFSGILPEGYTMAQYARRGFFEMALLCGIDLGIIALAIGFVSKNQGVAPRMTRLLCLFIGLVTVFFVVTSSAKMLMYIDSYGLTRMRLLTEVIMVFLGLATAVVCLWLFLPKLPYFKVILILGLCMGLGVLWADVDTVVARYNVTAYQQGQLDSVDMYYLESLGDGAIPQIARLVDDANPYVAQQAWEILQAHEPDWSDLRDWNYSAWIAGEISKEY